MRQPDHHFEVPLSGLVFVGAEQTVPPGQIEAVVDVGLPYDHQVVDPVHVRRDHDQPEDPVQTFRNTDIAVDEPGSAVQGCLENQHRQKRRAEHGHGHQLDGFGYHDFDGMKPQPDRYIEVQIGIVHHVQSPEHRNGEVQNVLRVDRQIQQDHTDDNFGPIGQGPLVDQCPMLLKTSVRHMHRSGIVRNSASERATPVKPR